MITVTGLRKAYRDHQVVDGVDLEVAAGSVQALLGPNGAGKTTIVEILTTYLRPDAGTARVAGHDLLSDGAGVRGAIGVTGQFSAVDPLLTAADVPDGVELVACDTDEVAAADVIVVLTEHDDIDWDLIGRHAGRVLDTRNRVAGSIVDRL